MQGNARLCRTVEKAHGRVETRTILVCDMPHFHAWEHASQCFKLTRTVCKPGAPETTYIAYGITSLPPQRATAQRLLALSRGHWNIKASHWLRDTLLREDASTLRKGHSPHLNAIINAIALCLLHALGYLPTEGLEIMADNKSLAINAIQC